MKYLEFLKGKPFVWVLMMVYSLITYLCLTPLCKALGQKSEVFGGLGSVCLHTLLSIICDHGLTWV